MIDKLMRRGILRVNRRFLCKRQAESYNHILLRCPMVYNIWLVVYNLLGINWVIVGSISEELCARASLCKKKSYLLLIHLSIFWVVWNERNSTAFEGIEKEMGNIRDRWFHIFGSILLDHDINRLDDFENVIDHLIDL